MKSTSRNYINSIRNTSITKNNYFEELNFLRTIACISVVLIHVTASYYSLNEREFDNLTAFLNQATRFGTPFFAILSGFLLYNQSLNKGFNLNYFLKSRTTKILIPFVIWSFIYLSIKSFDFSTINDIESAKRFIFNFVTGKSHYHLYFIAVIIQFYIIFPFLQLVKRKKTLVILTIISFYINYFHIRQPFSLREGLVDEFIHSRSFIFYWIFYFFLGALLVHYWKDIVQFVQKNIPFFLTLTFIITVMMIKEYTTFGISNSTKTTNLFHVPILFISMVSLYFLIKKYKPVKEFIISIGNMSMGIYLVHPLIIYYLRMYHPILFEKSSLIVFTFIIVLGISAVMVMLIHKIPLGNYVVIIAKKRKPKITTKTALNN